MIICPINSVHYGCIVLGDSILVTDYIVNMHSNYLCVVGNNMTDSETLKNNIASVTADVMCTSLFVSQPLLIVNIRYIFSFWCESTAWRNKTEHYTMRLISAISPQIKTEVM